MNILKKISYLQLPVIYHHEKDGEFPQIGKNSSKPEKNTDEKMKWSHYENSFHQEKQKSWKKGWIRLGEK